MTYVKSDNYRIGTTPQCYAVLAKCGHDNVKSRACFMPILFGVVGWTGCADEAAGAQQEQPRRRRHLFRQYGRGNNDERSKRDDDPHAA